MKPVRPLNGSWSIQWKEKRSRRPLKRCILFCNVETRLVKPNTTCKDDEDDALNATKVSEAKVVITFRFGRRVYRSFEEIC
jgi:hypothetical protein